MEKILEIFEAAKSGRVAQVTPFLVADPCLVHARDEHHWNPLHHAAHRGHTPMVALLLRLGAEVMGRTRGDYSTPLHWAAAAGHRETLQTLIQYGADVNATDDLHRRGPLGWAVMFEETHYDVACLLMEKGAKMDIFSAVALHRNDVVKSLVKHSLKRALVHDFALSLGSERVLRTLVRTDPNVLSARMSPYQDGRMPLHLAVLKNLPEMVELLLQCGADLHGQTISGRTALCLAAEGKHTALVDRLLARGAQVDERTALALGRMEEASGLLPKHSEWTLEAGEAITASRSFSGVL